MAATATASKTTTVEPPITTPATSWILSEGSDDCPVTDAADVTAGWGEATVCGVVLLDSDGMSGDGGVVVAVDRRRSRSPPAGGRLTAATAAFVATGSDDDGAALDVGLSSDGRVSPEVDSQRSRDDSRQGFRSVCDPLSLCGESTDAGGREWTCSLQTQEQN